MSGIHTFVLQCQPLSQHGGGGYGYCLGYVPFAPCGGRETDLFLDNTAAALMSLCFRARVGNAPLQRVFRQLLYVLSNGFCGAVFFHWVFGSCNPMDPRSRLASDL